MFIGPFVRINIPLGTSAILLLAASALQAQVIVCNTNAGVPPVVRAEGSTELVGDVILQCTGGVAGQVTRSNLTLILNTDITSRSINASQTEALLIVDEFGSPTQGSTAAAYTSLRGTGTNTLVWNDIPITAPGQNQTRTLRMTNVRANATGVPASATLVPSQIFAFLSVTGLALDNPQQAVAFVQPGLTFDVSDCTGTDVIPGGAPVGCGGANNSGNRNLLSGTSGNMQYSLRFKEARYTSFQRQISTGQYDQTASVPGVVYLTESGFVRTSTYPYEVGLANHGTRLHARFTNVPVGFRVFVTNTQSLGSTNGSAAVLVQVNGTYVAEPLIPRTPTAMPGTHTLYCPDSQATGFGAVEVPITDGSGEAVWEVTASQSTSVLESLTFGVAVAHSGTPIFGQSSVEGFFGPRYPANQQALPALPMPRFGLSAVPLSAHSMSAVSVAPTVLPANATTTLTIRLADTSCVPSITGIIFDRSDLTPGAMNQVNATTWTVPVTVAPNAAPGAIQATISTSGPHLVVPLGVGPALYAISGQVTRLSLPLAGVTVTLSGAGSGVRTTDSSGNYSFANLAAGGQYGLQVALANHSFEPPFFSTMGLQANVIANFIATPTASALPFQPLGPSPAAGATISATNPTLSWSPDSAVSSYDVYFGTTPTPPLVANVAATTFTPPTLKYGVTYYWRVVAKNSIGSTASSIWYFVNQRASGEIGLGFYPLTPCRIADTRTSQGKTGSFGPPRLSAYVTRSFPITASPCNVPGSAQAFSLNFTAIPMGTLDFISTWPTGQSYPGVSTLNAPGGTVLANAAIVPAGTNGSIEVVAGQATDLVIDTNGYFGHPATGHLLFHPSTPCRIADTRTSQGKTGAFGPPFVGAYASRDFPVRSACAIPSAAQAFALNMTVVPVGPLDFLSMWPTGLSYPGVSTLNSPDGSVIANAAIVPAGTNGAVTVVTGNPSEVIMDINGYFAPETFPGGLHFYRLPPCRVMDTRTSQHKTGAFGPPALAAYNSRNIPIRTSACNVPADAQAYSLNMTVVPSGPMSFLSAWQAGQPFPNVSTLNAPTGRVIANAAIVPAGANGDITVLSGDATELIIDINGYFAP